MKDLIVDLYTAPKHAQLCMKELGITYQLAVPQSINDTWWFFNCENVPAELPEYLSVRDFGDLNTIVGFGLSQIEVRALLAAREPK